LRKGLTYFVPYSRGPIRALGVENEIFNYFRRQTALLILTRVTS